MSCGQCGDDASYFSDGVYTCHPCHIGAYNVPERRWIRTQEEIRDTETFIYEHMPLWRNVPKTVQLTIVRNAHDKNTERWVGLQLSQLSIRNGVRVYQKSDTYAMKTGWSIVITAEYENRPPKLLAFTSLTFSDGKAKIGWYVSGQVKVDDKHTGLGALLIMTSVYLARGIGAYSVELHAINSQVAHIYKRYGYEPGPRNPDSMKIPNITETIEKFHYVDQQRAFIRVLETMLETDDQQRQFYNSIQASYDRLLPSSLRSESIWQYAQSVVKNLIGAFREQNALSYYNSAMHFEWSDMQHLFEHAQFTTSPFKNAKRAIYLGYGTIEFSKVCEQFRRIADAINLEAIMPGFNLQASNVVVVLPKRYTDRSFVATLLFLSFIQRARSYSKIRFLTLGDEENFLESFTAKHRTNYYYPLDICVSNDADMALLENTIGDIEDVAFDVKGSDVHGFDIYCTAAYVTNKVRKLCNDRNVILFNPAIVPTIADTMREFNLIEDDEKSFDDDRIVMAADYIDYRKLPIFMVDSTMIASLPRDIPVTKQTYDSIFTQNLDVNPSSRPNYVTSKLPLFDLFGLVTEALTMDESTLPSFKPKLTVTKNVFAQIATFDPATMKIVAPRQ